MFVMLVFMFWKDGDLVGKGVRENGSNSVMDSPRASLQSRASLVDSLESAEPTVQIQIYLQKVQVKFSLIQFSLSYPKSISLYRRGGGGL